MFLNLFGVLSGRGKGSGLSKFSSAYYHVYIYANIYNLLKYLWHIFH